MNVFLPLDRKLWSLVGGGLCLDSCRRQVCRCIVSAIETPFQPHHLSRRNLHIWECMVHLRLVHAARTEARKRVRGAESIERHHCHVAAADHPRRGVEGFGRHIRCGSMGFGVCVGEVTRILAVVVGGGEARCAAHFKPREEGGHITCWRCKTLPKIRVKIAVFHHDHPKAPGTRRRTRCSVHLVILLAVVDRTQLPQVYLLSDGVHVWVAQIER